MTLSRTPVVAHAHQHWRTAVKRILNDVVYSPVAISYAALVALGAIMGGLGCSNPAGSVPDAAPAPSACVWDGKPLTSGDPIALVDPRQSDPVPETAKGPTIPPDKGYLVQPIGEHLYAVLDGFYQSMFLVTGAGVIVVDAPPSTGAKILEAVRSVTTEPITHVIYSHHHSDHIGAADSFPAGVIRIAHKATADLLARDADPKRPVPAVTFDSTYTLTVGSETLELAYLGDIHEPGNIFIYAPKQKVLMVVDVIFPGWVPFARLAVSHDIVEWTAAPDAILKYDFTTLVAGHLTRLGTRADVLVQKQYLDALLANAGAALASTPFADAFKEADPANPWAVIDLNIGTVAHKCAVATLAQWRGKLGGADVQAYNHCWTMAEALRID
jgi:glyoxylase-like metal-dependent hydrolase (beta-lactamase superfamily II)